MTDDKDIEEHLYKVSIDVLGLSEGALKLLRGHGFISVGDCLDACCRDPFGMITPKPGVYELCAGELGQKLKEHGFMPVSDDET